jgi:chromosome segregation ATPase
MSKLSLLDLFRCRWQEIARQFWPETPRQQLKSELSRVEAELTRRQNRLLKARRKIEKIRHRLKRCERHLAQLASVAQQRPSDGGVNPRLECQRRSIARLQEHLQTRERSYSRRLARLRQRKQEWAELRERLLSGSVPKARDDERDADYPF